VAEIVAGSVARCARQGKSMKKPKKRDEEQQVKRTLEALGR
jgi:hypothetical protein